MAITYHGQTDTGRQRQNNEDAFIAEPVLKDAFIAAGVIDGVGGYEGGEVAAALARTTILDYLAVPSGDIPTMLREAFVAANDKIIAQKSRGEGNDKMACVLTLALVDRAANKFYYAHVGDTRLYLYRDGSLVKITKDQSFVGFLEDNGKLTEAAAMAHPKRNEINKALGFETPLPNPAAYIEIGESPFLPGDLLLVCSDGLTDLVDKSGIVRQLATQASLTQKAAALIAEANKAGGKDNITVVLVQHEGKGVKQKAVKPAVNKSIAANDKPTVISTNDNTKSLAPVKPDGKNNKGLLAFLIVVIFLSIGGFLWQWMANRKLADTAQSVSINTPALSITGRLQDTLGTGILTLNIDKSVFGDTVLLDRTLQINTDSLHIMGNGSTVFGSDSASGSYAQIQVLPTVKYLLLDSLVLRNISIQVGAENRSAVHFKDVQFTHVGLSITSSSSITDRLFSGSLPQLVIDSFTKTPQQAQHGRN